MRPTPYAPTVAVIGAGLAGAACAASLQRHGLQVTLFDKSTGAGGRMATRCATWRDAEGQEHTARFDHGAAAFTAAHPRFRALVGRAEAAGAVARWRPRVHAAFPEAPDRAVFVPVPDAPALCRHVIGHLPVRLEHAVQRLRRSASGWQLVLASGGTAGPFDHVMLAVPAPQAAPLLAGHQDDWADALAGVATVPCWTLMAVTDDADWPWDAAAPEAGPLGWVARSDRPPGRVGVAGRAIWVAHADAAWSTAHLDDAPEAVARALQKALRALLPCGVAVRWHHAVAHRWRHASPSAAVAGGADCWWEPQLNVGVCGDFFGNGTVEAAWRSGDELADAVVAWLEAEQAAAHVIAGASARAASALD